MKKLALRGNRLTKHIAFGVMAFSAMACDPTEFDRMRNGANVIALKAPAGLTPTNLGIQVAAYQASVRPLTGGPERWVSRAVVSSGSGGGYSAYHAYEAQSGKTVQTFGPATFQGCLSESECGAARSESIAAFPAWLGREGQALRGCVVTPMSTRDGMLRRLQLRCESEPANSETIDLINEHVDLAAPSARLGAAAAALPFAHQLGAFLETVPGANGGQGQLVAFGPRTTMGGALKILRLQLSALAGLPANASLGREVAVSAPSADRALIALAGNGVLIVGRWNAAAEGNLEVVSCETSAAANYASSITFGDLDGDGLPELVVAEAADAGTAPDGTFGNIRIIAGSSFAGPAVNSCGANQLPVAKSIGCPTQFADVSCDMSGFGQSIAVARLATRSAGYLLVGAPRARVDGREQSGTVFVLGANDGAGLDSVGAQAHRLVFSSQRPGARLGSSVAALPASFDGPREDILAGTAGSGGAVVFVCSGIPGDRPEDVRGLRGCIPQ